MLTLDRGFPVSTPCHAQSVLDPWCCSLPLQDSTTTTPQHALMQTRTLDNQNMQQLCPPCGPLLDTLDPCPWSPPPRWQLTEFGLSFGKMVHSPIINQHTTLTMLCPVTDGLMPESVYVRGPQSQCMSWGRAHVEAHGHA